jgi:hypothetical protein
MLKHFAMLRFEPYRNTAAKRGVEPEGQAVGGCAAGSRVADLQYSALIGPMRGQFFRRKRCRPPSNSSRRENFFIHLYIFAARNSLFIDSAQIV